MKTLSEDLLQSFAQHLGVDELAFGNDGTLVFQMENSTTYSLEEDGKGWILCFFKPAEHRDKKWYATLLAHCLPDQLEFEASIGLLPERQLWIGTHLKHSQLTLQSLLKRFEDLKLLAERIENEAF